MFLHGEGDVILANYDNSHGSMWDNITISNKLQRGFSDGAFEST